MPLHSSAISCPLARCGPREIDGLNQTCESPWRSPFAVGSLIVWLTMSCVPGGDLQQEELDLAAFAAWDSAGIQISESSSHAARAPADFCVDPAPELQIGAVEGGEAYQFHRLGGMMSLPDGRILAVNAATVELRYFDEEGRFLKAFGTRGEGPGEFLAMSFPRQPVGDTLILLDPERNIRRMTWITADGELIRTARYGSLPGPQAITNGLYFAYSFLVPAGLMPPAEPERARFFRLSDFQEVFSFEVPGTYWSHGAPQTSGPALGVSNRNFFFYKNPLPDIRVYAPTGELLRLIRLREDPPTRDERFEELAQDWIDRPTLPHLSAVKPAQIEDLRTIPLPVFRQLQVDDRGWLWARRFEAEVDGGQWSSRVWVLFDEDGRARGSLESPEGLAVRFIAHDHLLGVWRDDFGVEYIRRHRVRRGSCE